MTASKSVKKVSKNSDVVIKAPKLNSAWSNVCTTSTKSESEIIKSIENLSATMVLESRLSVSDMKKFIKSTGKTSSFVSVSHVPALPTWSKLRALHADFRALPLAKQLSTASASYDLLGAGKGEQIKTLDGLTKEISTLRKAKAEKSKESSASTSTPKVKPNALASMLAYFTALDVSTLTDEEIDMVAEINAVIDSKMVNA